MIPEYKWSKMISEQNFLFPKNKKYSIIKAVSGLKILDRCFGYMEILMKRQEALIMECDYCAYNAYDEEMEEYYCSVSLDEDDMARFLSRKYKSCPYFKNGDEYQVVRHQM